MKTSFMLAGLFISVASWAQPAVVDSLRNLLADSSMQEAKRTDILNELAYQIRRSDPESSLAYAQEALSSSLKHNHKRGEGRANFLISAYYRSKSAHEKSLKFALSALQIFEAADDKKGLMDIYSLLGVVYNDLKERDKATEYVNRSLELGLALNDNNGIARVYGALGNFAMDDRDREKALKLFLKALGYSKGMDGHLRIDLLTSTGRAYIILRDMQKAKPYLDEAMLMALKLNDKTGQVLIYLDYGFFYKVNKDFATADGHYEAAERLAKKIGDKRQLLNAYISLMDVKMRVGNKKAVHDYQMKYAQVRDSVFKAEKAQQIAELETLYETEKSKHTIQLLEQEKRIQNVWRNALLLGVLFISLAAFLIYRLQRSRARKTKQLLDIQRQLNENLKETDKLKSRFFANISHEFRTPLSLILAPIDQELREESLTSGQKEAFLLMRRNANRLLELVNQLLDLSKLESGKMELRVKREVVEPFFKVITASFDSWAQHKQIEFITNINVTQSLWIDRDKVEKIITNLLANAFKFTPPQGVVTLTVSSIFKDTHAVLSIAISDTGKGIPEEEQEKVFLPFYQSRQTVEGHQAGTGLGLPLVKELVKLHHGTISLRSKVSQGTVILIELPAEQAFFSPEEIDGPSAGLPAVPSSFESFYTTKENTEKEYNLYHPEKDSVLIVEDNADLRDFMSSILQHEFTVFTASNGAEGMELTLRMIPSLVLSDLMMPEMDGIQLTEKIKSDERTSHIPVILLTAKDELQSRLLGLKTGADDYMTKPFSSEELMVRILNLIDQRKRLAERFRERTLVPATLSAESSLDERFLQKVKDIVENHLSDFSFTVEKMAEEINLSRTQLLRKLKALTGLAPNEFIKDLRLKKAADMIRQRTDTITQIGYAVGFNDQSYFTKCFKKQFGITPSDYSLQFSEK